MDIQSNAELDRPQGGPTVLWLPDFALLFAVGLVAALISPSAFGQTAEQHSGDEQLLPKPPLLILSYAPMIPSMPLTERISRGVVPKRGPVSTGVDGGHFFPKYRVAGDIRS
jgi:hypothetical protein